MTLARTEKMVCPGCGKDQQVVVYSSINRNLDPELLVKLFEDSINVLVCSSCQKSYSIDVPLMYHDMDRKYVVSYYPTQNLIEDGFYQQFTPDGKLRFEFPDHLSGYVDGQKANHKNTKRRKREEESCGGDQGRRQCQHHCVGNEEIMPFADSGTMRRTREVSWPSRILGRLFTSAKTAHPPST